MSHKTANFAFEAKGLLFCRLGKLSLERVPLPAVASLLPAMVPLTLCQSSPLSSFVQSYRMNLMRLTLRAIRPNFFGNIQFNHDQLCIKKNIHPLILFRFLANS